MPILLAAALAAAAPTPAAVLDGLPRDLADAVTAYDRAQIAGDGAALRRLLADDYMLVNSRGAVEDKRQMVADYTAPGFRLKPYVVEQATARAWEGGAVLAGAVTLEGTDGGKPFSGRLRFADVWRRTRGAWQVVFTEVTPLR